MPVGKLWSGHRCGTAFIAAFALAMAATTSPSASAQTATDPHLNRAETTADALAQDRSLRIPITLSAASRPLGGVLREVSSAYGIGLSARTGIADQRITVHLERVPLYKLMNLLARLLSHSLDQPKGYYWERLNGNSAHPAYRLWRDAISERNEQLALDEPRQRAIRLLREFHQLCRATDRERQDYKGELAQSYLTDPDLQPFRDALGGLSDEQLDELIRDGAVPISLGILRDQVASFNRKWRESEQRMRTAAIQSGAPDPFPNGVPDSPPDPPRLSFQQDLYGGEHPERSTLFGLRLEGVSLYDGGEMHVVFDPLRDTGPPDLAPLPGEPTVDIAPALLDPAVTPAQRSDSGFTFRAIARAAGTNLYQEHFFKPVYWGAPSRGLRILKGTPTQLINAACKEWGFTAIRNGRDVLIWSRTWAYDRAVDVPDRLIQAWIRQAMHDGGFTFAERLRIASELSWPQLRLTLDLALPASGPWDSMQKVRVMKSLAALSPEELSATFEGSGLALGSLSPDRLARLSAGLLGTSNGPSTSSMGPAVLRGRIAAGKGGSPDRVELQATAPTGRRVWSAILQFEPPLPALPGAGLSSTTYPLQRALSLCRHLVTAYQRVRLDGPTRKVSCPLR